MSSGSDEKKQVKLSRYRDLIVVVLLILTAIVYWQVGDHAFLQFDDDVYVSENLTVQKGITLKNISWAFSTDSSEIVYWHPVTWFSHMLDCELFGLNSGRHHLMNLFIHLANVFLLYLVLRRMTGATWKSVVVAAFFALHPINVESVAWLAERKNLLSTFFWMLTMLTYSYYIESPRISKYLLLVSIYILGLLSKPMLVTLPFVLLLLDYWPLKRFSFIITENNQKKNRKAARLVRYQGLSVSRLVAEKIPLIILALISIVVSSLSLAHGGFTVTTELAPMMVRIENAIVSYVLYICKMLWPHNLTFYYPYPDMVPLWQVFGSFVLLAGITLFAFRLLFRAPYIMVGWLWYVGTLSPVSGIMQGGLWPAIAERWAYIPLIGLFIIAVWGSSDLVSQWRYKKEVLSVLASTVLLALASITLIQVGYWKDNISFFSHGIKVDPKNFVAHTNLGQEYLKQGKYQDARYYFEQALQIHMNDVLALKSLGRLYNDTGEPDKSIYYFSEVIKYSPDDREAYSELGSVYAEQGDVDLAIEQFSHILRLDPENARAFFNLGVLLAKKGEIDKATDYFFSALKIDPQDAEAHCSLGVVLMNQGKIRDAIMHFNKAITSDPDYQEARTYLSEALNYQNRINEDVARLEQAWLNKPKDPQILHKLAVLYSYQGEQGKALDVLYKIREIQPDNPDVYYNIACIHSKLNNVDESINWLRRSIEKGFNNWDLTKKDPDLSNIRDTEYFKKLLKEKNSVATEHVEKKKTKETGFPPARE